MAKSGVSVKSSLAPEDSHCYADAKCQQMAQRRRVDRKETAKHNRHTGQVKRNHLEEISESSIDTSTMRKGSASLKTSRKGRHSGSDKEKLGIIKKQNIATLLAIHSPQLIPEHPMRQDLLA